ncbi:hypothetical protein BVY00_00195 [bacterium G20]|nr:hypothetical protein BVY00_00195 [bacterium G20]
MSSSALPYEFHVTVEADGIKPAPFIKVCRQLGVKAIVLDLGVNNCSDLTDYMTSSKAKYETDAEALDELSRIAHGLNDFTVIRRKIETVPWHQVAPKAEGEAMPEGCYFESHLAIECRPEEVPGCAAAKESGIF